MGWHPLRGEWGRWRFNCPYVITYGTAQSSHQTERNNDTAVAEQYGRMYEALSTGRSRSGSVGGTQARRLSAPVVQCLSCHRTVPVLYKAEKEMLRFLGIDYAAYGAVVLDFEAKIAVGSEFCLERSRE